MADYKVTDTELISIANAIRTKGGTQAQLEFPTGFVSAIQAIPTGSGAVVQPLNVTQNGVYNPPSGVDGYAPVTVNVSGGGGATIISGTGDPTPEIGSDGDIYLKYISAPSEYALLDYLEVTTQGPYIDTGVQNQPGAYVEIEANWTSSPGNNYGIFGCQTNKEYAINSYGGVNFANFGSGRAIISNPLSKFKIKVDGTNIYIDGVSQSVYPVWGYATGRNYYLFAINYTGGPLKTGNARIYKCILYNFKEMVRYFVPVRRLSDSELGMLDLVTKVFYPNIGTGSFTAGGQGLLIESIILSAGLKVNGMWQNLIGSDIQDVG